MTEQIQTGGEKPHLRDLEKVIDSPENTLAFLGFVDTDGELQLNQDHFQAYREYLDTIEEQQADEIIVVPGLSSKERVDWENNTYLIEHRGGYAHHQEGEYGCYDDDKQQYRLNLHILLAGLWVDREGFSSDPERFVRVRYLDRGGSKRNAIISVILSDDEAGRLEREFETGLWSEEE